MKKRSRSILDLFRKGGEDEESSSAQQVQQQITEEEQQEMISGVEGLAERSVREVMIPRTNVEFISDKTPFQDVIEMAIEKGFSRYPVYQDRIDTIIGVLYVKDMLRYINDTNKPSIGSIVREPFFVPETKKLDGLLREFRIKKVHIAVVVDEYGGVAGIVCLEDIIEEIVGEIQDEYDNEQEDITPLADGSSIVDGRILIEEFNEELQADLPHEDFDTLGGYLFSQLGKVPEPGEVVPVEGWDFEIVEMEGLKISKIRVEKHDSLD